MGIQTSHPFEGKNSSSLTFFGAGRKSSGGEVMSGASSRSSGFGLTENQNKRRKHSASFEEGDDPWGWFEDFGSPTRHSPNHLQENDAAPKQPMQRAMTLPAPATAPVPVYVLESSLSYQRLWYETAGRRPRQPPQEREFYEKLWERNFKNSDVNYQDESVKEIPISTESARVAELGQIDVMYRGKGSFSNAVSKSFLDSNIPSVTIQIPRFRVRRCEGSGEVHAEYLVVVSLGKITFGVWRRHSDFKDLASKVQFVNISSGKGNKFKNAILSWQCLIHRQRWFRCLDKDYLGLKCFLLERFMHDLLFESNTPDMISEFLGIL